MSWLSLPESYQYCTKIKHKLLSLHCFFWFCNLWPCPPLQAHLAPGSPRSALQAEPPIHPQTRELISSPLLALVIDFVRRAFTALPLLLPLFQVSASISLLLRRLLCLPCLNYPPPHFIAGPITSSVALS